MYRDADLFHTLIMPELSTFLQVNSTSGSDADTFTQFLVSWKKCPMLTNATPCVIVLDLWMPEMSGYAFLEMLHQRNIDASIPIIVVTADARQR